MGLARRHPDDVGHPLFETADRRLPPRHHAGLLPLIPACNPKDRCTSAGRTARTPAFFCCQRKVITT